MSDCCTNNNRQEDRSYCLDSLDGMICYCFKKSKREIFDAIKRGNHKIILDDIKSKMKDPGCFCETSNPSGKCCLADIHAFIKAVESIDR